MTNETAERRSLLRRAAARPLGGRLKAGHDEEGCVQWSTGQPVLKAGHAEQRESATSQEFVRLA